ncbi:MAG TPA: class I SAM-dependent methyltransferase [Anaerolineales bacterium]|nr:class I SAM-dependent methyltransferase [Anaerolineales bacterium]
MAVNIVQAFDEYRAERVAGFLAESLQPGARVLDCGCGKMRVGELISEELDIEVIGVDLISLSQTGMDMCLGDGSRLPFADNSFDSVYAVSVLHHTKKSLRVLKECVRVARDQLLVVEDVYRNGFELALLKLFDWLGNRPFAAEMSLPFTFRSEREWSAQFEKLGLKIAKVVPVRPVPWRPTRHRMFILGSNGHPEQFRVKPQSSEARLEGLGARR